MLLTQRLIGSAALLALFVAGGCDDPTGAVAGDTQISVRAYVDANGSGSYDAGDLAISGATVTLTEVGGGEVLSAQTDGDGVATFADAAPGSYRASFDGTAPSGAVLSTATSPVVVAPFQGAEVSAEFRFTFNPGQVQGALFRDDNGNGTYDEGVDLAAIGIPVALYAGTDTSGDPIATTSTDASGRYSFAGIRPGSYTVEFSPFPTMTLAGGNTRTVEVGAGTPTLAPVAFTGDVLVTIATARAGASGGSVFAVRGVVINQPSYSDELFIQDETAGIQVFAAAADVRDLGLSAGDTVIVVGTGQVRFGETQLTNVSTIIEVGSGPAPEALATTANQINAGELQARLVQIEAARVTDVDTLSFNNQFVTLVDAAGNSFGVYADSRTGVGPSTWVVGQRYDVTGVVGYDSRFAFANRIEVRSPSDVQASAVSTVSILAARSAVGDTVTVEGVVSVGNGPFGSSNYYVQDATGGIAIFQSGASRTIGDRVRITGRVSQFNDEVQIGSPSTVTLISTGNTVTPIPITINAINAGQDQGELATVSNVTVQSVTVTNSFGTQEVVVTNASGDSLTLFVDNRTGISASDWTVGATYTVTGVVSRFRSLFELKPRRPSDVVRVS